MHNYWWVYESMLWDVESSSVAGKKVDYGNQLTRYKLEVRGSAEFAAIYAQTFELVLWALEDNVPRPPSRFPSWHAKAGHAEMLFLDGHAGFLLTDTNRPNWRTRSVEWTVWFNEAFSAIPERFKFPYPGIADYYPPGP